MQISEMRLNDIRRKLSQVNETEYVIEALDKSHIKGHFFSGSLPLDAFLQKQASQDANRHLSVTYALLIQNEKNVIGFYTLASTSIALAELPENLQNKLPHYPLVSATLLGRLAVDKKYHGNKLGELLLMDALQRSYHMSHTIGSMAVVVDAKDHQAVKFYQHYGFIQFPNHEQKLFIAMETIKKLGI